MTVPLRLLLFTLAALAAQAQEPDLIPEVGQPLVKRPGGFHLDLLPKSFSSKPKIDMTVYSERTDYGRTLPDVTPENPAYYMAQSQGYQPMGSSPAGVTPPSQEQVEELLRGVLEKRGYLPSDVPSHPPTLALFYYWGAHAAIDLKEAMESPELMRLRENDILQRAKLVGGRAYAEKLLRQLTHGTTPADHTPREEHLRYQVQNDIYYVVISAYEFSSLTRGERRLVWRTTMTVNDQGVSMKETLPTLIVSATDFLGRDTGESVAIERRINRSSVTLGPLIIIESGVPNPAGTNPQ